MALARFVVFDQADCGLSTMIFSSVQVPLILLFRNYQVTSDPAWHLRSVGLLNFLLGIDTNHLVVFDQDNCVFYVP